MKTILYSLILPALSLMIDATATKAQRNDPCYSDPTEMDILTLVARFETAAHTNDAKAFAACFATDAEVTIGSGQIISGPLTIQNVLGPAWTKPSAGIKQVLQNPSIRFLKSYVAIVDIRAERISASLPPATPDSSESYLLSWIVTREGDGQWLIKIVHAIRLPQPSITTAHK